MIGFKDIIDIKSHISRSTSFNKFKGFLFYQVTLVKTFLFRIFIKKKIIIRHNINEIPKFDHARLLFTCQNGLFLLKKNLVIKLLPGFCFGITRINDSDFYIYRDYRIKGNIYKIKIDFEKNLVTNFKRININLPSNVHQILNIEGILYLTSTKENAILKIYNEKTMDKNFIEGELLHYTKSDNYKHFNSLTLFNNNLYLLAHNYSQYSKKKSQVYVLNKNLEIIEKLDDFGECSHDILFHKSIMYVCDSLNSRILDSERKEVFKSNKFLRGFKKFEDNFFILGGSDYNERAKRTSTNAYINILDNNFKLIKNLEIKGIGPLFDILVI